jgi:LacI family transcriptional regulator
MPLLALRASGDPAMAVVRTSTEPHVALTVNKARSYGRGILQGVADYVEVYGPWSIFLDPYADGQLRKDWLRRWRGDGILAYAGNQRIVQRLLRCGIPCVEIYGVVEDRRLPRVGCDDRAIGRLAGEHLLGRELKRFAYCGLAGVAWSDHRGAGFATVVIQAGFPCHRYDDVRDKRIPSAWEKAQNALAGWIAALPKPVGLMASTDIHAQQVLDACRRAAVAVPEEVAVIGVDNDEDLCRLCDPPLSSVVNNSRQIGYEGARLLARLMGGELRRSRVEPTLIQPLGVVPRGSTDVTAIENQEVAEAVSYIRKHACEGIQAGDVARAICRSRATLYRMFEGTLGRAPKHEILRLQLDRAKTLLTQTNHTMDEIAELAGFSGASYFSVVFKREVGMTAGTFRANHRNGASQERIPI